MKHSSQHVNSCGLSSTIMAEKSHDLILLDREGQLVDCLEVTKLHGHFLQFDWVAVVEGLGASAPDDFTFFVQDEVVLGLSGVDLLHLQ